MARHSDDVSHAIFGSLHHAQARWAQHRGAPRPAPRRAWHIGREFNPVIGVYAEGLGGYVSFYLALAHGPFGSLVCENSPAIMTEAPYRQAVLTEGGPWAGAARRRRLMISVARRLVRIAPRLPMPISSYLDWAALKDARGKSRDVERRLVAGGYLRDPDFDRWHPFSAVTSLMTTPPPARSMGRPPRPCSSWPARVPPPAHIRDLYHQLPPIQKKLAELGGSVYWMLSHPGQAATTVSERFAASLAPALG